MQILITFSAYKTITKIPAGIQKTRVINHLHGAVVKLPFSGNDHNKKNVGSPAECCYEEEEETSLKSSWKVSLPKQVAISSEKV